MAKSEKNWRQCQSCGHSWEIKPHKEKKGQAPHCEKCDSTKTMRVEAGSVPPSKEESDKKKKERQPVRAPSGGFSCAGPIFLLLLAGGAVVGAAKMGYVDIPGLSPPKPEAQIIPKPAEPPPPPVSPPSAEKNREPTTNVVAKKLEPSGDAAAPRKAAAYPPITPAELERARALYAKVDFAGVQRALDGCERPEVEDSATTQAARALIRKARLLEGITKGITKNILATATKLEQVSIEGAGTVVGLVTDAGEEIKIVRPGGVEVIIKKDQIAERTPVGREKLVEQLKKRLKEKEERIKPDDALGNFRIGHYCWQYALTDDAMPYLEKAISSDDFPVVARVFGGSSSDNLVKSWYALTGKTPPNEAVAVTHQPSNAPPPPPGQPPAPPPVASKGGKVDQSFVAKARAKYEEGVVKYRTSFGDSKEAQASLKAALKFFHEARDLLNQAGDDESLDELRQQIARLIYDCSKRSTI